MPHPALLDAVGDPRRIVTDAELNSLFAVLGEVDDESLASRVASAPRAPSGDRREALLTMVRSLDLTSLHATDDADTVRRLCARAREPDTSGTGLPATAAVCVTPDLVRVAVRELAGSGILAACVAGGFPSGRTFTDVRLAEVRAALDAGADELDVVIDRAAVRRERYAAVIDDLRLLRLACDEASTADRPRRLKVILEIAELGGATQVRRAAWLALIAGADMVKTSTGTVTPAATPEGVLLLCDVVAEFAAASGSVRGVKAAGGIRQPAQALKLLALAESAGGDDALVPSRFRIGASSLLDGVVAELRGGGRG